MGTNIIAVELHQVNETNNDLSFNLALFATNRILAPYVEVQPTSLSLLVGQSALFNVGVTGTQPLQYQWRFNDAPIVGANGPTLALGAVGLGSAEVFRDHHQQGGGGDQPDGQSDGCESRHRWRRIRIGGSSPNRTNPNLNDAALDPDHDGMTNQQEFRASGGQKPKDGSSYLKVIRIIPGVSSVTLEFLAAADRSYTVLYRMALTN